MRLPLFACFCILIGQASAQDDFPAFPSANPTPSSQARKPVMQMRVPNAATEPRAYYDYCTSAAAYWKERADKAKLPAELNSQNAAMENVAKYRTAATSVRDRAFAAPLARITAQANSATSVLPTKARELELQLPAPLDNDDLKDSGKVNAWVNRLLELKVITVMHVQMDEAQADFATWSQLRFDIKRMIAYALAYYMKYQGRSGKGTIIDQGDGRILASFDLNGVQIARPATTLEPAGPVMPQQ